MSVIITYFTYTSQYSNTIVTSSLENLKALDTSTSLESGTTVVSTLVVLQELYLFEIMSPKVKSASTTGLANVIMASVFNDQTKV